MVPEPALIWCRDSKWRTTVKYTTFPHLVLHGHTFQSFNCNMNSLTAWFFSTEREREGVCVCVCVCVCVFKASFLSLTFWHCNCFLAPVSLSVPAYTLQPESALQKADVIMLLPNLNPLQWFTVVCQITFRLLGVLNKELRYLAPSASSLIAHHILSCIRLTDGIKLLTAPWT